MRGVLMVILGCILCIFLNIFYLHWFCFGESGFQQIVPSIRVSFRFSPVFYLSKITRLIYFFTSADFSVTVLSLCQRPIYVVWICNICPFLPNSEEIKPKVNQKSCLPSFYWATITIAYKIFRQFFSVFVSFPPFLFWIVSSNLLCLSFNVTYFELLEHGHPRRLRETEDPGYRQLRQSHARYSTLILQQQCSGSGSTGSTCFWASWIRIH